MAKLKKAIFSLLTLPCLLAVLALPAGAVSISDYTSFPPFLPRVVSPNILFLLDLSKSMIRPAYGECNAQTSNCQTEFNYLNDDYDSSTRYEGYFDNGYRDWMTSYSDSSAARYTCSAGGLCTKVSSGGDWNGNWLNWLTMTQFDVLKKVVIGGDMNPAPEGQNAPQPDLHSKLAAGYTFYKIVSTSKCLNGVSSDYAPICSDVDSSVSFGTNPNKPQQIAYKWINTPFGATTALASYGSSRAVTAPVPLPFDFTFYGRTFDAGTSMTVNENGWLSFLSSVETRTVNYSLPTANLHNYTLAPYWENLEQVSNVGSNVKYFTVGAVGRRIFVITFDNIIDEGYDTGKADVLDFQILLFEGSNQIVFQYAEVQEAKSFGKGLYATVGVQGNALANEGKLYSHKTASLRNGLALLVTPGYMAYTIKPQNGQPTVFQPSAPLAVDSGTGANDYEVEIRLSSSTKADPSDPCTTAYPFSSKNQPNLCYDHDPNGLYQKFRDDDTLGVNGFRLGFMTVGVEDTNTDGGKIASNYGKYFNNDVGAQFFTNTRQAAPQDAAPLAEAMREAMHYFRQDAPAYGSDYSNYNGDVAACPGTGTQNTDPFCFKDAEQKVPCARSYALLISAGNYSDDNGRNISNSNLDSTDESFPTATYPDDPSDIWRRTTDVYNSAVLEPGGEEGLKANGGWLDNVAYFAHTTDLRPDETNDLEGKQTLTLYVVNTSNDSGSEGAAVLKRAALFGGFKDINRNDNYDDDADGDPSTSDPEDDPDDPRTYFEPTGNSDLKAQILNAVTEIIKNSASGTSVSVLSTSAEGTGALYQAYFYPARIEGQSEERRWPGFLRAFFLDRKQNLRDDFSNTSASGTDSPDSRLVMAEDRVAHMSLDESSNEVKVKLLRDDDGILPTNLTSSSYEAIVSMDDVPSIWEGGKKLAERTKGNRKIYLWVDQDNVGDVDDSDWTTSSGEARSLGDWPATDLVPYLRAQDTVYNSVTVKTAATEASEIVDFVKGNHVGGYRNRCIDIGASSAETGCSAGQRVWPLGDIIYSTPTLVGAPGEKFDLIYGDSSYRAFTNTYKNRRQVVYTGANDGMLHAFNAGVYHAGDDTSATAPAGKIESGWFKVNPDSTTFPSAGIGDERWAFIPHDNLPHLAWLACNGTNYDPTNPSAPFDPAVCGDAEYTHVYYVDHRPKVTDARIFYDSTYTSGTVVGQGTGTSHPNGWGTILILPLRMGGGAMDVTADFGSGSETREFRSAYYAFDITDPELPPKLLWRFSHGELGFSVGYPGIVRVDELGTVKWFMVVGSGPVNSIGARDYGSTSPSTAAQAGKFFVVDLATGNLAGSAPITLRSDTDAIMGDPTVVDADLDFSADVIYIGSAIGATSGRVYRININGDTDPDNWDHTVLFDPDTAANATSTDPDDGEEAGPLLVPPSVSKDIFGNLWVFFGTGRLRNSDDLKNSQQQRFYGIKDGCWKGTTESTCPSGATYTIGDLLNTNLITVTADTGSSTQVKDTAAGSDICGTGNNAADGCSYATMLQQVRNTRKGWYLDLANPANTPSERVLSRGSVLGGLVLFTTYKPLQDMCSILGDSTLYAVYYETGTAYNKKILPQSDSDTDVAKSLDLGAGMPTSVGVAIGDTVSGFVQKSTGEIVRIETAPGLGVRSGAAAWRENSGGGTVEIESIYKHIVK